MLVLVVGERSSCLGGREPRDGGAAVVADMEVEVDVEFDVEAVGVWGMPPLWACSRPESGAVEARLGLGGEAVDGGVGRGGPAVKDGLWAEASAWR